MGTTSEAAHPAATARDESAKETTLGILDRLFPHRNGRPFTLRLWDGHEVPAGPDQPALFTLLLTHPGSLRRMFWPPGELTLGEAYLRGDFDVEGDMVAVISLAEQFRSLSARDWLSLLWRLRALPKTSPPAAFERGRRPLQLSGRQHSKERDLEAVTFHYDTGNDFYALFLGKWMAYSCGYFAEPGMDLDAAQAAKFDLICRKLRLKPGERLLDIGCGWGGLVVYAAENYGVQATGITLSQPQVDYGQEWIRRAGLSDRATIELRDYRDVDPGNPYDKIVSVGMVEHVGRSKLAEYFEAAYRGLRPGGLFLNHAIATHRPGPDGWLERTFLQSGQFMQRYVFPDGELVRINAMLAEAEASGYEVRDVESLREHYALTLRHWIGNLESQYARAVRLKDERTYRTWRLYMSASVQGFESGRINVYQSLLSTSRGGVSEVPLTRADLYRT